MGHATRAAAILRQVRRLHDLGVLALTNTPLPVPLDHEDIPFIHFPETSPDAMRAHVAETLARLEPRVLVVDVFPSGIVGELAGVLPELPCRKILVYRHVQQRFAARMRDALSHFDLVLLAEGPAGVVPGPVVCCRPILLRDADELLSRVEAKSLLGASADQTVVLGVSTDSPAWTQRFFRLLRKAWERLQSEGLLRLASPYPSEDTSLVVQHYPLLELFNGVDVVVGPSGYNLFHEAQACEVEGVFTPRARRYDDQFWRARNTRIANNPEELEALLADALAARPARPSDNARFVNGAVAAASAIVGLLR